MTTVLVVHGTGGRQPAIGTQATWVAAGLHALRSNLEVRLCDWGDAVGARLGAGGASIPLYNTTMGVGGVSEQEVVRALWAELYEDPLYELRLLSLRAGGPVDF